MTEHASSDETVQLHSWLFEALSLIVGYRAYEEFYNALVELEQRDNLVAVECVSRYFSNKTTGKAAIEVISRFRNGVKARKHADYVYLVAFIVRYQNENDKIKRFLTNDTARDYLQRFDIKVYSSSYGDYFFQLLRLALLRGIEQNGINGWLTNLSLKLNVHPDELVYWFLASPTSLFQTLSEDSFSTSEVTQNYGASSALLNIFSSTAAHKTLATECKKLRANKRSLLLQLPSPLGDTVALPYELGRFLRISKLFGLKPLVKLYDELLTNNNPYVQLLKKMHSERFELNMVRNIESKMNLYKRLVLDTEKIDLNALQLKYEIDLKQIAQDCIDLLNALQRDLVPQHTLADLLSVSKDQQAQFVHYFKEGSIFKNGFIDKYNIMLFWKGMMTYFGNYWDVESVFYLLCNYLIYCDLSESFKVAAMHEFTFDHIYEFLDIKGARPRDIDSVYFDQYFFTTDEANDHKPLDVVTSYFPSGGVLQKMMETNNGIDLKNLTQDVIMLDDNVESLKIKARAMFTKLPLQQLAIQLSDFISFLYFYALNDAALNREVFNLLSKVNTEWALSWQRYVADFEGEVDRFKLLFFTLWTDKATLPFWYFPFVITLHPAWELRKEAFMDMVIELYRLTLKHLQKDYRSPYLFEH